MVAQGRSRRRGGLPAFAKYAGIALLALVAVFVAWKAISWGYHRTVGYDILGRWRAEQTSLMGFNVPIGLNLEFDRDSAVVLDTRVPVVEYERDGNRVHVVLQPDKLAEVSLTFVFDDRDHMVFEGPFGVSMRYRRAKAVP